MELNIYKRKDGKWAWRLIAQNGQVVATDGGQGYERRIDATDMALSVIDQMSLTKTTFST